MTCLTFALADVSSLRLMTGERIDAAAGGQIWVYAALIATAIVVGTVTVWRFRATRNPADAAYRRMARGLKLSRLERADVKRRSAAASCHPVAMLFRLASSPALEPAPIAPRSTRTETARALLHALSGMGDSPASTGRPMGN